METRWILESHFENVQTGRHTHKHRQLKSAPCLRMRILLARQEISFLEEKLQLLIEKFLVAIDGVLFGTFTFLKAKLARQVLPL